MTLLIACSLFLHAAAAEPSVEILSAYQFPQNVCKVLIRNGGEEPLDLREPEIRFEAGDSLVTAVWTMAEPDMAAPGQTSWLTAESASNLPAQGEISMRLNAAGTETPFSVQAGPGLVVTYCVLAPEEGKAYIFVLNAGGANCTVTAADINGASVALAQPVEIPARKKSLLCGKCAVGLGTEFEVPQVVVRLTPSEGASVQVCARMFKPEHTVMRGATEAPDTIECLSHAHGADRDAAKKAVAAAAAWRGKLRTIKFCNVDTAGHAAAQFAQIMERNHTEPQLAYSGECASAEYVRTLLESVENTRCATQPGITYTWVFPSNSHDPSSPPYGIARLRGMVYAILAGGSKGFELSPPKFEDPSGTYALANSKLLEQLAPLRPFLAFSDPVDLLESEEPAGFVVRTLVCGDKGILLFVLPLKDNAAHEGRESLRIREPGYLLSAEAFEITSGDSFSLTQPDSRHYTLDVPLTSQAQLYLIPAVEPAK